MKLTNRRLHELRADIAETIAGYRDVGERGKTHVPNLFVGHITRPVPPRSYIYEPSLCVCVQGEKRVVFGDHQYTYDPDRFLLTSIGLPTLIEVPGASAQRPYTALQVHLDLSVARQIMAEMETGNSSEALTESGFGIVPMHPELLDVLARLVALLEQPRDVPVLAPLLHREILYRLLSGSAGGYLRQVIRIGSQSHRVAEAIAWLRTNYASVCRVEELAELCGMGVSTLYRHFQEITTMTPIQYQKHLRLHEARRLMLTEELDAAGAAIQVGYESATQFSREYRRLFGMPPKRDVTAMRKGDLVAVP
ncbi:AraC family transcriptional regulator [Ralstonia solanacearum]|uniref:AraC family transcriptional regulator n=1 Tax=Ralstonia solanacearum TaxID=305 RepID=UPI000AB69D73|nr:AraC family transcriptional regulator [Ralstonia solanacearum]